MPTGTVKSFNETYGTILPDDGSREVYVSYTALQREGYFGLNEGQKVEFEVVWSQKGPEASWVKVI